MRRTYFILSVLLFVAGMALLFIPISSEAGNSTQTFTPARYALTDAEIDVSIAVPHGPVKEQKVMFKLDSVTGDVWVLQLTVTGQNDPSFAAANWVKVQHGAVPPQGGIYNQGGF